MSFDVCYSKERVLFWIVHNNIYQRNQVFVRTQNQGIYPRSSNTLQTFLQTPHKSLASTWLTMEVSQVTCKYGLTALSVQNSRLSLHVRCYDL
jgi:hypothetical protein